MSLESVPNQTGKTVKLVSGDSSSSTENTYRAIREACHGNELLNPDAAIGWPSRVDGIVEFAPARTGTTARFRIDIDDPSLDERAAALSVLDSLG